MTYQEDISAIRQRIARAESQRDIWRVSGPQEKYLEAYSTVEALQMELGERLRQPDRPPPAAAGTPISRSLPAAGGHTPS